MLCNDREILGPWVNRPWLNALGAIILGTLIGLSAILTITVLMPQWDGIVVARWVMGTLVIGLVAAAVFARFRPRRRPLIAGVDSKNSRAAMAEAVVRAIMPRRPARAAAVDRADWRMPPLAELVPPVGSKVRTVGMVALRAYLLLAVTLLVVKTVELAIGH
jgi:hypothetical protein